MIEMENIERWYVDEKNWFVDENPLTDPVWLSIYQGDWREGDMHFSGTAWKISEDGDETGVYCFQMSRSFAEKMIEQHWTPDVARLKAPPFAVITYVDSLMHIDEASEEFPTWEEAIKRCVEHINSGKYGAVEIIGAADDTLVAWGKRGDVL